MSKKMLIDAAHPEETRVVVVQDNRVEDFDFESATKIQIRGNIYLAKVTRIEPSLQAAFVDYGGNRHGFLAFNEIHPDYYQIPVSDRQALIRAEQKAERAAVARDINGDEPDDDGLEDLDATDSNPSDETAAQDNNGNLTPNDEPDSQVTESNGEDSDKSLLDGPLLEAAPEDPEQPNKEDSAQDDRGENGQEDSDTGNGDSDDGPEDEEMTAAQLRRLRRQKLRSYKIQEVIKRRQIILVQVVKEERGNKGAALTTYLSLAGRYCVLMPNTGRGGGISRKITNQVDRQRLKKIVESLDVPDGTGLIIRTAGDKRTKAEIKRDYEYLLRLWENIRSLTLESIAPTLVHEEGSLVKRSIRDLYRKEIDSIFVEGEESYREAKEFMRMLVPSHAKNVKRHKDNYSIFQKYNIEPQLDSMFSPHVQLKSGGYIVINPTEALVAIDVNSGRATRERSIEKTALQTNLEAAEEVARQCRLRDLAGLVVIDFIDMGEHRNNRAVEKRLRECFKNDRARVQIGRISNFGLLEFSRQRMRSGVLEGSTSQCSLCHGSGVIRSVESTSLRILRAAEEQGMSDKISSLTVRVPSSIALYLLNQKRPQLQDIEACCGINVVVDADTAMASTEFQITTAASHTSDKDAADSAVGLEVTLASSHDGGAVDIKGTGNQGDEGKGKRRRRRRARKGERVSPDDVEQNGSEPSDASPAEEAGTTEPDESRELQDGRRRRRRGRRGGRRHAKKRPESEASAEDVLNDQDAGNIAKETEATSEPIGQRPSEVEPVEPAPAIAYDQGSTTQKPEDFRNSQPSQFDDTIVPPSESQVETTPISKFVSDNAKVQTETSLDDDMASPAEVSPEAEQSDDALTLHESSEDEHPAHDDQPRQTRRGGWWQRRVT